MCIYSIIMVFHHHIYKYYSDILNVMCYAMLQPSVKSSLLLLNMPPFSNRFTVTFAMYEVVPILMFHVLLII